jgi:cobalt-zinc-cadmium efflux system outer membrane protein
MTLRLCAAVPVFVCLLQSNAGAQSVSLSLEEALALAREQSPAVLIARARIEEARARLIGARVRFRDNPTFDVGGGPRDTEVGTLADLDIGFSQSFETGGQRAARIAGAEAAIVRETAAAAEARRLALRAVALAYLRAVYAQERIGLLRGAETVAGDVMTIADRRYAAGDIAALDVNMAKIGLVRARAARLASEGERTLFAGDLERLIGMPPGSSVVAAGSLRLPRRPELASLLAAVTNRPDLRAMEADIRDAEADVRLGHATKRPDVGLGARMKREEGHRAVIGVLTITLPLFNQGQELRAAGTARAARLRLELETTHVAIESEVRSLSAAYAAREAALKAFEQDAMPGVDENEALARRSFEVGQISLPELLLVRRELVDTRLEYLNRLLEAAEAAIEQDAAAGVLQ